MKIVVYHREADWLVEEIRRRHPRCEVVACIELEDVTRELPSATVLLSANAPQPPYEQGASLKWVQTGAAGVDRVLPRLRPDVILSRGYRLHDAAMSEHCLGRILAWELNLRQAWTNQTRRRWERYSTGRVAGKVLGICGLGTIGSALASRARALGMRVVGLRRRPRPARYVERVYGPDELMEFAGAIDYLVILLPLTAATRGMIDERVLSVMKPDSVLINLGRGAVVNEGDLIRCLQRGRPGAALLDVFEQEPLPASSELWAMQSVSITPHNAGGSTGQELLELFLTNLDRFTCGQRLQGQVGRRRGY